MEDQSKEEEACRKERNLIFFSRIEVFTFNIHFCHRKAHKKNKKIRRNGAVIKKHYRIAIITRKNSLLHVNRLPKKKNGQGG